MQKDMIMIPESSAWYFIMASTESFDIANKVSTLITESVTPLLVAESDGNNFAVDDVWFKK